MPRNYNGNDKLKILFIQPTFGSIFAQHAGVPYIIGWLNRLFPYCIETEVIDMSINLVKDILPDECEHYKSLSDISEYHIEGEKISNKINKDIGIKFNIFGSTEIPETLPDIFKRAEEEKIGDQISQIQRVINDYKPDLIGISCSFSSQVPSMFRLLFDLNVGDTPIVIGGSYVIAIMENILTNLTDLEKCPKQYIKVLQEKDITWLKEIESIVKYIACMFPHKIPSIISQGIIQVDPMNLYKDVTFNCDIIPQYNSPHNYLQNKDELSILTSRGCDWGACSFCGTQRNRVRLGHISPYELYKIIIKLIKKYEVNNFNFLDETFGARYIKACIPYFTKLEEVYNFKWEAMTRADRDMYNFLIEEKGGDVLEASGCKMLYIGFESANEKTLQRMNKGRVDNEKFSQILHELHRVKIFKHLYYIVGFPGETMYDMENTELFLQEHKDVIDSLHPELFVLEKSSAIYCNPKRYDIKITGVQEFGNLCDYEPNGFIYARWEEIEKFYNEISLPNSFKNHFFGLVLLTGGFWAADYDKAQKHIKRDDYKKIFKNI